MAGVLENQNSQRQHIWRVLLPLGLGTALSLAGDLTLYAALPAYAASQAFSMAMVGLMLSANRLVRLGSNPLVGLLLAGARRRSFLLAGFGLGTISTLLYVLAQGNSGLFLAGRILWGISWSLINIGGYCMVLDVTGEQNRGWASGILQSFIFAGLALNPLIGGLLSDRLGFNNALLVCAGLSAVGFLIALAVLPETRPESGKPGLSSRTVVRGTLAALKQRLSMFKGLAHPRNAAISYIYFAANFVGDGVLLSTLSLYLQNHYGSSIAIGGLSGWTVPVVTAGGALLGLRAGIGALVAPLAGDLSDRLHSRWSSTAWGIVLCAAGLLLILGLDSPWALLGGVALAASGGAILLTVIPPLAREANPGSESGTILGLLANSADLGMALAPLATYALLDRLRLETIYGLAALAMAAGLLPIWLIRKR